MTDQEQFRAPNSPAEPAPYQTVHPEQRRIWETKGKRAIGFGVAWALGGLLLTIITYSNASGSSGGFYVIAWGPVLYGAFRIFHGCTLLKKNRQ